MGLFNFGKKEQKREFRPKVVLTENVSEELVKTAKEYYIPVSSLDFNLISCKTYVKFPGEEFIEANKELLEKFMILENLINEEAEIKQVYEIEIIKYKSDPNFELIGEMKVNELYTYAEFKVSKNSLIKVNDIFEKVKTELNKKKIRNSLLIDIFDLMDEDIKKLQSIILIDEKLNSDFTVKLCKGLDPIISVKGRVLYHFKKNKDEKNLIYPVKTGDVLIEIILPKPGRNGRDCRGKIIKTEELGEFKIPEIAFDEKTIEKKSR